MEQMTVAGHHPLAPRTEERVTPIDPRHFRECLGRFATGVTVVSYWADGAPRGATVNSFTSVSLDPPLVLVSISRRAKAAEYLHQGGFCVNVLNASQMDVALGFAGRHSKTDITWVITPHAPRLRHSHAWLDCTPWRTYDGGDHLLLVGEVHDASFENSEPLLFHGGAFHTKGDVGNAPERDHSDGVVSSDDRSEGNS